jgi:xylulokinase
VCTRWCDTRAAAEAKSLSTRANYVCPAGMNFEWLYRTIQRPIILSVLLWCGGLTVAYLLHLHTLYIYTTSGFTAPKIMWLKSHEPENYRRTAKIMLPHDYINYYLSGNEIHVMERGDSSGMGIFSLQTNAFDDDLVNFIDKDLAAKLPIIVDPHLLIGSVSISVFRVLFPDYKVSDDSTSILLAPGCGDNAMSTLAVTSSNMSLLDSPNIAPPPLVMSLGTSGTLCTVSSHTLRDPTGGIAPFCDSTGNFLPLICIQNCTLVPEEMRKMFPALSIEEITDLAEKEPPGCEGVLIIPYFSEGGERTPNWPDSTGCLIGLKHGHMQRPGLLYRAALESIAYALLRGYQRMVHHGLQQSEQNSKINVVGGGAGNTLWRKIIADVFQIPVVVNNHEEATKAASAVGAALQAAAIALGVEVGSVALDLPKGSVTSCLPTSDTSLCDVYNAAFKRHVSISNSLFEVDLSAGDTTS